MPSAAPKPCGHPGCGKLVRNGSGRCERHQATAWVKKPTATKRITGRRLQAARVALFRSSPLCVMCESMGRLTPATQRDHIVPLSEGGLDEQSNTQGLCDECHEGKSLSERLRAQRRARA